MKVAVKTLKGKLNVPRCSFQALNFSHHFVSTKVPQLGLGNYNSDTCTDVQF